jgi:predicted membrane metal-binding protein
MSIERDHAPVKMGSNRSFGLVFAAVFALVAGWPLLDGGAVRLWAVVIAAVFAGLAAIAPRVLAPLNRAWFRLGLVLGRIVTPIVMGLVYATTVVPIGLILRARGKDLLRLKADPAAKSYWLPRADGQIGPDRLKQQF